MLKNIFILNHFFDNSKSKFKVGKILSKLNYRHFYKHFGSAYKFFIYWDRVLKYERFGNAILEKNLESNKNLISRDISSLSSILYRILSDESGVITHHLNKIKLDKNGIEYYFVEITSKKGVRYGIPAFGEEALELYKQIMSITSS